MKGKFRKLSAIGLAAVLVMQLTACGTGGKSSSGSEKKEEKKAETESKNEIDTSNGFYIEWNNEQFGLSAEEIQKIKDMNLSFAIEAPTESDFGYGQIRGFKDACKAMGIKVAGEAYCELDPAKQQENMENFVSMNVDGIVCQAQEAKIAAQNFNPVVDAGIKLAFTGSVPEGYTAGKEYVTMVSDEFANEGKIAAKILADKVGGKGDVLAMTISSVNYVSNTRDGAFVDSIKKDYPGITLAEEGGIESASDAGAVASAMLTRHPEAKGMFVTFSTPALEVLEIVKSLGKDDFKIVTVDLDSICCLDMINEGNIAGIVCDSAYYYASAATIALAKSYLGQQLPAELAGPGKEVTPENLREMWKWSFGEDLPKVLDDALNEKGIK